LKKYFIAFLTTFIFSSFVLANDENKTVVVPQNPATSLTSNENHFEYLPNIDELINTLGKKDSFTITIPKDADYTSKGIPNFSKTRIISKTELKDAIKLVVDSSRDLNNYTKPTIYNETFTTKYSNYSTEYSYYSGYVTRTSLIIELDKNADIESQKIYYKTKISELLIKKGFEQSKKSFFWNGRDYEKEDVSAEIRLYGNQFLGEKYVITFNNENVIKDAMKKIDNVYKFDTTKNDRELEQIFR